MSGEKKNILVVLHRYTEVKVIFILYATISFQKKKVLYIRGNVKMGSQWSRPFTNNHW